MPEKKAMPAQATANGIAMAGEEAGADDDMRAGIAAPVRVG
jgi:hypothetical protein